MGGPATRRARSVVAWQAVVGLIAGLVAIVSPPGPARPAVAADTPCGGAAACVLGGDGRSDPAVWEDGTTRLALAVAEPPEKDTTYELFVEPADGRDGRTDRFHRFDVAGGEGGLRASYTVVLPARATLATFDVTMKGDAELEPDEWFDLRIVQAATVGHSAVRVVDDEPAAQVDVRFDAKALTEGDTADVAVRYTGSAAEADVTIVPMQDPTSSRVITIDPPVMRLAPGVPAILELTVVADHISQGDTALTLAGYAYAADRGLPQPEPVEPTVAGRPRPVHGESAAVPTRDVPPLPPLVAISQARTIAEGGTVELTVTRSQNLTGGLTIPLTYLAGTATPGEDYAEPGDDAPTAVFFGDGQASTTLSVTTLDDAAYEGDETFQVQLATVPGVTYGNRVATVTIDDRVDFPVPQLVPGDPVTVPVDGGTVPFHLAIGQQPRVPVTYRVATVDVTAVAGDDYVAFDQQVTIPAEQTNSAAFEVVVGPVPAEQRGLGATTSFGVVVGDLAGTVDYDATQIVIDNPLDPLARYTRQPEDPAEGVLTRTLHESDHVPVTFPLIVTKPDFVRPEPYELTVSVTPLTEDDELYDLIADSVSVDPPSLTLTAAAPQQTLTVTIAGNDVVQPDLEFAVAIENLWRMDTWAAPDDIAEFTIVDDDSATDPDNAPDTVRGGIGDWFEALPGWAPAFAWPELADQPAFPVLPDPVDYFAVEDLLENFAVPGFDPAADALEDAVADFEAHGCTVDWVLGGAGGRPEPAVAGDVLQVSCAWTLADVARAAGYAGSDLAATPDALADVATALGLDATIGWSADVRVQVTAGVDAAGFYLLGATGVSAAVSGAGEVAGDATLLGAAGVAIAGAASADVTLGIPLDGDPQRRVRTGELPAPDALLPGATGEVDLVLGAAIDDAGSTVDWDGGWAFAGGAVTTDHTITLTQSLPGFTDDGGDPVALVLTGTSGTCAGAPGWTLAGTLTGEVAVDGLILTDLDGSGCIAAGALDLTVTATLLIGDADPATTVDVTFRFDGAVWTATGTATFPTLTIGTLTVDGALVTMSATGDATGIDTSATISAASATLGDDSGDQIAALTGIEATLLGSRQVTVNAEEFDALVAGGALVFDLDDITIDVPAVGDVLVAVGEAQATAPNLGASGLTVTVSDLAIHADGRFSATSVEVVQPDGIAQAIGLGGLLPVDLTGLVLRFTNVDPDTGAVEDLAEFTVEVEGIVDLAAFDGLPFVPEIQLGGAVITPDTPVEQRRIAFSADVEISATGAVLVTPDDVGPIRLGFTDLPVGPLTIDAYVAAVGYVDGVLQTGPGSLAGSATVTGAFGDTDLAVAVEVAGELAPGTDGPVAQAAATIVLDVEVAGGLQIDDLTTTLELAFGFDADGAATFAAGLSAASLGAASVPFGEFATAVLGDVTLDPDPGPSEPFITVGGALGQPGTGAGLEFGTGSGPLAAWGGRVGGFTVDADGTLRLADGFFADVSIPDGETFGLPDFLPLDIDRVGIGLPDGVAPGDPLDEILADLQLSITGGLAGTAAFPLSAGFDELTVDLGRLVDYDPLACGFDPACFPVDLAGFRLAIEPSLELGAASVSGALSFGTVTIDTNGADPGGLEAVLYGHVAGHLRTPAFEAGAEVVITEFGPVLLRVTAPAAVPLGQTGLIITGVTGAAAFGDADIPTPSLGNPEELIAAIDQLPTEIVIDTAAIAAAVAPAVVAGTPTWEQGFAIALEGRITHLATAGMITGAVTIATSVRPDAGPQLVGAGDLELMGIPLATGAGGGEFARAAFLIDLADPLAPSFDLAAQVPVPGSPLAALLPAQASAAVQLRTDGIVTGLVAGAEGFAAEMSAGTLDAVAARLAGDPAHPLTRLVVGPGGDPATLDGTRLGERLIVLLSGPEAAETVGPLLTAIADYVATLDQATAEAFMSDLLATFRTAAEHALTAAEAEFEPQLTIRGRIQPMLLGIPTGEPDQEVELILTKRSFGFTATGSVIEQLKTALGGSVPEPLVTASMLGMTDRMTFGVQVPLPSMTDVIFGRAELEPFRPSDDAAQWSITVGGSIEVAGMRAEVSGFLTGAGNQALVDARVEKRWQCSDGTLPVPATCAVPPDPTRLQLVREVDYDHVLAYGGLVLDARLEMPRLITDPVDVIGEVPPLPEDSLAVLRWFADAGAVVTQTETPLRATLYLPGLGPVLAAGTDEERSAAARDLLDAISLTGVFEGTRPSPESAPVARLLSIPIGEGRMVATTAGLEITADIPLLGAAGTFAARVDEVPFEGGTVVVPVGKLDVAMSTAELDAALGGLGVPPAFDVRGTAVGAGLRAYSPGYDPDSADPLQRTGGAAFTASLDAPGFVDGARVEVLLDLAGTGAGPDFAAIAAVDTLGPFGGVTVTDAELTIVKRGADVSIHVEGRAAVLGSQWDVVGDLQPDLTGSLVLTGTGGELPDLAGFRFVSGGLAINLSRSNGTLVGSVGIAGEIALPAWMAGRAAASTVAAAGCLASDGDAELRLALGTIALDPAGHVELAGTGTALPADPDAVCLLPPNVGDLEPSDARVVVRRDGGVTTVAIDGALRIAGAGAPPLLAVSGVLTSDGDGSLLVEFGPDGAPVGGFTVTGTADLTLTGGTFELDVDGAVTVPGVGTLAATGSLEADGDFRLTISSTGFRIGGPGSPFFAVGTFSLRGVDGTYSFGATGAAFEYRQANGTVLFRAAVPTFAIGSDGSFAVATQAFRIGPASGVRLHVPATTLAADAAGAALRVRVPANAQLVIPGLADGASGRPAIALPTAVDIDTIDVRYVLVTATGARAIDLGLMRLTGRLVFERIDGGPFQLAIEGPSASTPARIDLGELGRVDLPDFRIADDATFDVLATTQALGPASPRFRIVDAAMRLRNTGSLVELTIAGGALDVPSLAPIDLPTLSVRVGNQFTRDVTIPALDLGPVFRTTGSATFTLTVTRSVARFQLKPTGGNDPAMVALAGSASMRLQDLLIDSNGTFDGSVTGRLALFGDQLAQGTFDVRLRAGLFELHLPSPGLGVDWGFGTVRVAGSARSDGTFSFSGAVSTDGSLPGVSWNGSATITATHQHLRGSFGGNVSVLGLSGGATGTVDSTGRVTGTLRVDLDGDGDTGGVPGYCVPVFGCTPTVPERATFQFRIGGSRSPDRTAPTMPTPSSIAVTTSSSGTTIPVSFAHPVATDDRDGRITSTCNPGSGSDFTIGASRTVTCTARDAAGNRVSRSFTVTVSRSSANVIVGGGVVMTTVGGFAAGSSTLAAVHSEPTAVAEAIADAAGVAHYEFRVPAGLAAGEHHIVAVGTTATGAQRQWVVPIEIGADGTVAAVDSAGATDLPAGAGRFVPITPVRLFDTRHGTAAAGPKGPVGPLGAIDVQVTGPTAGVPAEAVAVVINLTVTNTAAPGFVTAYPTGVARPNASAVNIVGAGQTRPNLVTVPIGAGGKVSLYSHAAADLLGDVAGYYLPVDGPTAAGRFVPLSPERLFDTRPGGAGPGPTGKLGPGAELSVGVLGAGSVPATGVAAVVLNLTATDATAPGFLTAYPTGVARPWTSNVNLSAVGDTAPNLAIVPLGADGTITVYSSHGAHVLADVTGYITDDTAPVTTAGLFVAVTPERVFDTRASEPAAGPKGYVPAGGQIDVAVGGVGSVPATASAVVLNVTGIDSPPGFVTAWPSGPPLPTASTLNFAVDPLDTRANGAMLPLGEAGRISLFTRNGSDLLADVSGYFL